MPKTLIQKSNVRDRKVTPGNNGWWSEGERVEAVKTYLVLGNMAEVSRATGVPYDTLRKWQYSDWWSEIEEALNHEDNFSLSVKLRNRISKAVDIVEDRLDNGDFQYDPRTGKFIRKPVSLRDTWKVAEGMTKTKMNLDNVPLQKASQQAITETLVKLTEEFQKMAAKRPARTIDASDFREVSEPTTAEGTRQIEFVRDSNLGTSEVGQPQTGHPTGDGSGDQARQDESQSAGESQSIEVLGSGAGVV